MIKKIEIAAFDFDGTLTQKDTFLEFVKFVHGNFNFYLGLFLNAPILILMKLKLLDNGIAKQMVYSYFFKGFEIEKFNIYTQNFKIEIEKMIKADVLMKLKKHQNEDCKIIIISASIENWIEPWAKSIGIEYLAGTKIEVVDGILTGKFITKNCYGREKVNRLLEYFPNRMEYTLYAYGDSAGDNELLKLADHAEKIT